MEPWRRIDRAALGQCCGSSAWVSGMLARQPFASRAALFDAAHEVWWSLSSSDWREAFAHHPRIGDRGVKDATAAREQSRVNDAPADTRTALAAGNEAYFDRFGYIFIVCATGKSAEEMLALLRQRLGNDPETELRVAAAEQDKITSLRLEKLTEPGSSFAREEPGRHS